MTADPTETLRALMPFAATLGIELLRYEPEEVRARLAWRAGHAEPARSRRGGEIIVIRNGPVVTLRACKFRSAK